MHLSFLYDGMILLLSSFMKMMSINARIFKGSSSNLLASRMSSSLTFSVTILDIFIFLYERMFWSIRLIIGYCVEQGCRDVSLFFIGDS